jgi:hypothetical protein
MRGKRLVVVWAAVLSALVAMGLMVTASPAVGVGASTWLTANSVATGDQDGPAVAVNRSGDVAVVWEDDRDATNPGDDSHSEIYLRLFRNGMADYEMKPRRAYVGHELEASLPTSA